MTTTLMGLFQVPGFRWESVQWRSMPPPQDTWVLVKSEGADGDEQIGSGYVNGDRLWSCTVYDGLPKPSLNDHVPLSIFEGWAPIIVPSEVPKGSSVSCCPFCGNVDPSLLRELSQWSALSQEDTQNTATWVEWRCLSDWCQGKSFLV